MGLKRRFKQAAALVSLGFILLFLSSFASAAELCCITENPHTCEDISLDTQCQGGTVNNGACSSIPACDEGCCCSGTGSDIIFVTRGECTANSGTDFSVTGQGYDNAYCNELCETGGVTLPALYSFCEEQNDPGYKCGGVSTTASSSWCCAADSAVFENQSACQKSPQCVPENLFSISGTVTDAATGGGLPGVALSTAGRQAYSLSDGSFTLQNIPQGTWKITAALPGYITAASNGIEITTASIGGVDIAMSPVTHAENCNFTTLPDGEWDYDLDGCEAWHDSDCENNTNYMSEGDQHLCSDKTDNDCDGYYDCNDPDCFDDEYCKTAKNYNYCGDGNLSSPNPNYFGVVEECESDSDCGENQYCSQCECVDKALESCGDGQITGEEECDPYASENDPSWACTSIGEVCDAVTCRCILPSRNCGNGNLEKPQEECEFSDNTYAHVLQDSFCSATQCIKPGEPGECLCRTDISCGNGALDKGEECDAGVGDCESGVCSLATCTCESCDEDDKTPALAYTNTTGGVKLSWSLNCHENPERFLVNHCSVESGSTCIPSFDDSTDGSVREYEYNPLDISSNHCFSITSTYSTTENDHTSNIICLSPPAFECTFPKDDYFCEDNTVMKCASGKKEVVVANGVAQDCTAFGSYICIDYPHIGEQNARCIYQSPCDKCNGWYGMFSADNRVVFGFDQAGSEGSIACNAALSCYLDYTPTSVDKYYECSSVSTCYDYKSKEACVGVEGVLNESSGIYYDPRPSNDDGNKCGMDECEWAPSGKFSEFGIGVCRPKDTEKQECGFCDDYSLNNFYGNCNQDLCALFGDCYYDDPSTLNKNGLAERGCVHRRDMACQFYDNEDDCTGKQASRQASILNTSWSGNAPYVYPSGGTNEHLQNSSDYLSFGLCVWNSDACFKDGDGNEIKDCQGINSGIGCMQDTSPPDSETFFVNPLKKDLGIKFSITDKESPAGNYFHFNIVPKGDECYPEGMLESEKVIADRKSTRLNSSHTDISRMPSSA